MALAGVIERQANELAGTSSDGGAPDSPDAALRRAVAALGRALDARRAPTGAPTGTTPVDEVRSQTSAARHPEPEPDEPPEWTTATITIRDRVAALRDHGQADAVVFDWLHQRLGTVLDLQGVTEVVDVGEVDVARQEVVGTQPAPHPAEVDRIASTVRPGYLRHGQIIRPQQVIAYVATPERTAP